MVLTPRIKLVLTVVGVTSALFAIHVANKASTSLSPEDTVPRETFLAATIDGDALRASPIYAELFDKSAGAERIGLGPLAKGCGFDPTERVHHFALAVPEDNKDGDFGVAAEVSVTPDELKRCADETTRARGGQSSSREQGDFIIIESQGPGARIAYRPQNEQGGTLLVGKGKWLDAMIGAAQNPAARLATNEVHRELRAALAPSGRPAVLVTAVLPTSLRERLRSELAGEVGGGADAEASRATMAGVLGVRAVGAALDVGTPTKEAELRVELRCDDETACAAVRAFVERKKAELSRSFMVRLFAGAVLENTSIEGSGAQLRARAHAPVADLARLLKQAVGGATKPRRLERTLPSGPPSAPTGATKPDIPGEILRAAPKSAPADHDGG